MHASKRPHTIAMVDDHALVLQALVGLFDGMEGFHVVFASHDPQEFVRWMEHAEPPDMAVVDMSMPLMDGFGVIRWLRAQRPQVRPVMLSAFFDEGRMHRALADGACAYLPKDAAPDTVAEALQQVMATGSWPAQQEWLLRSVTEPKVRAVALGIPPRELEFLEHCCHPDDLTYDRIAERMKVSRHTVDGYQRWFMQRFGLRSRAALVRFALVRQLVAPPRMRSSTIDSRADSGKSVSHVESASTPPREELRCLNRRPLACPVLALRATHAPVPLRRIRAQRPDRRRAIALAAR